MEEALKGISLDTVRTLELGLMYIEKDKGYNKK